MFWFTSHLIHFVVASVHASTLQSFDATARSKLSCFQSVLYSSYVGFKEASFNISSDIIDILTACLIRCYSQLKALNNQVSIVSTVENALQVSSLELNDFLSLSIHLQNQKTIASKEDPTNASQLTLIASQTAVINELIEQYKKLLGRVGTSLKHFRQLHRDSLLSDKINHYKRLQRRGLIIDQTPKETQNVLNSERYIYL